MLKSPSRIGLLLLSVAFLTGAGPASQPAEPEDANLHWSHPDLEKTPSGLDFHGPFFNESVTVSAEDLPDHDRLAIAMDRRRRLVTH